MATLGVSILLALLLLQKITSGAIDKTNVVYGGSFNQQFEVEESSFIHCKMPLRIGEQLKLAESLYYFYHNNDAVNNLNTPYFLNKLRRVQRLYQVQPSVDTHPLTNIKKLILPYLDATRVPFAQLYPPSSPVNTPDSDTSSVFSEDEDISSDFEAAYQALGLGNVPGTNDFGNPNNSTQQSTTTVPTTQKSISERHAGIDSQYSAHVSSREDQSSADSGPQPTLHATTPPEPDRRLSGSSGVQLPVLRQSANERTPGHTEVRNRSGSTLSQSQPTPRVSGQISIPSTRNLGGREQTVGALLLKSIRNGSYIRFPQQEEKIRSDQSSVLHERWKRDVATPLLSSDEEFILLAERSTASRKSRPHRGPVQHGLLEGGVGEERPARAGRELVGRYVRVAPIRRSFEVVPRAGHHGAVRELHHQQQETEPRNHQVPSGTSALVCFLDGGDGSLGIGAPVGKTGRLSSSFLSSRPVPGPSPQLQEEDPVYSVGNSEYSPVVCSVQLKVHGSEGELRDCVQRGLDVELPPVDGNELHLCELQLLAAVEHAPVGQVLPLTHRPREKRLVPDDVFIDQTGSTVPLWRTTSKIISGQPITSTWKTIARKSSTQGSLLHSQPERKLSLVNKKDPLSLTHRVQDVLVRLAKKTMEKSALRPELGLTKALQDSTSELFLHQTLDKVLDGLNSIAGGKLMEFLPRSYLHNLTSKIKSKLDTLPAGNPYSIVNITEIPKPTLSQLPTNVYKSGANYFATLSVPIKKNHFTAYSYDNKETQILNGKNLYSLTFKPKHSLILQSPITNEFRTLPSIKYLNQNCVKLQQKYFCLREFLSKTYNAQDKCLTSLYQDQPSLKKCNGEITPILPKPIELATNTYAILTNEPLKAVHICLNRNDQVYDVIGNFNITLTPSCPRFHIGDYILKYRTPNNLCVDPTLQCKDPATNLFKDDVILPFLQYVDITGKGVQLRNGSVPLLDTFSQYYTEIIAGAAAAAFLLCLSSVLMCKARLAQPTNDTNTTYPMLTRSINVRHDPVEHTSFLTK